MFCDISEELDGARDLGDRSAPGHFALCSEVPVRNLDDSARYYSRFESAQPSLNRNLHRPCAPCFIRKMEKVRNIPGTTS